eukprot:Clim_evm28s242 gene=Clim_evmTU28s242
MSGPSPLNALSNLAQDVATSIEGAAAKIKILADGHGSKRAASGSGTELGVMMDSDSDADKYIAMRRVTAMMLRGEDVMPYFAPVVKNTFHPAVEMKKMVAMYLARNASSEPDLALLSINAFQKDLKSSNALLRGSSLRALCGIQLEVITPLVMHSLKQASADMSPYVKQIVAQSLPQMYRRDPDGNEDTVLEILQKLLGDFNLTVQGSALATWLDICPARWDFIHPIYSRLVRALPDMDEWTQMTAMVVLIRYARTFFAKPAGFNAVERKLQGLSTEDDDIGEMTQMMGTMSAFGESAGGAVPVNVHKTMEGFFSDDDNEDENGVTPTKNNVPDLILPGNGQSSMSPTLGDDDEEEDDEGNRNDGIGALESPSGRVSNAEADQDLQLLLRNSVFLTYSMNPGVLLAVIQLYMYVGGPTERARVAPLLMRLMRHHREVQIVVLAIIERVIRTDHQVFRPHLRRFFVFDDDSEEMKRRKLRILIRLADSTSINILLKEFRAYTRFADKGFVKEAIIAIGHCAIQIPDVTEACVAFLVGNLNQEADEVIGESIVVLRRLLPLIVGTHSDVVGKLATMATEIKQANARACVLWMMGEYNHLVQSMAPDVLRLFAKSFPDEEPVVKLQIVNLAAKMRLVQPEKIGKLYIYIMELARYDSSYDIRDRARVLRALLEQHERDNHGAPEQGTAAAEPGAGNHIDPARRLLLSAKPVPMSSSLIVNDQSSDPIGEKGAFMLGTMADALHSTTPGYVGLPDFPAEHDPEAMQMRRQAAEEERQKEQERLLHERKAAEAAAQSRIGTLSTGTMGRGSGSSFGQGSGSYGNFFDSSDEYESDDYDEDESDEEDSDESDDDDDEDDDDDDEYEDSEDELLTDEEDEEDSDEDSDRPMIQ